MNWPFVGKMSMAGDSVVAEAVGPDVGIHKHWPRHGIERFPEWFGTTDADGRPFNMAHAGSTFNAVAGQHGASITTKWTSVTIYGLQVYAAVGEGTVGIGANLEAGSSNFGVVALGANDLSIAVNNAYDLIYENSWTPGQIDSYLDGIETSCWDGIATYRSKGAGLLLLCDAPSYNFSPYLRSLRTDAVKRERVEVVIDELNVRLLAGAAARGLPLVHMHAFYDQLGGDHASPNVTKTIGGNTVQMLQGDKNSPYSWFQGDYIHDGNISALLKLDLLLYAFSKYGLPYTPQTESTLCGWAGMPTGGANTLNLDLDALITLPPAVPVTRDDCYAAPAHARGDFYAAPAHERDALWTGA